MTDVKKLGEFLTRYDQNKRSSEADALQRFKQEFNRLRPAYEELQQRVLEEARLYAPQFNIFRLLSVAHLEVTTHSAFLASLLQPDGPHGQQFLFLESFLDYCQQLPGFPQLDEPVTEGEWSIKTEKRTAYGNLDIVIASPTLGYLIVIENKVYASEQDQQLARYAAWLDEMQEEYSDQALIYLTPRGSAALTSNDKPYFRLSYRQDIAGWLQSILDQIAATSVSETVRQYKQLIITL
jgi:hypothetical protein